MNAEENRARVRRWKQQNPERALAAQRRKIRRVTERNRHIVAQEIEARGGVCEHCRTAPGAHWHHRDPATKLFTIADYVASASVERLQAELAKCDWVCKPCHYAAHRAMRAHVPTA